MDLPRVALSTYLVSIDLYPLGPDFVLFFSKLKINRTAKYSHETPLRKVEKKITEGTLTKQINKKKLPRRCDV